MSEQQRYVYVVHEEFPGLNIRIVWLISGAPKAHGVVLLERIRAV
jgi:hypothetical protein